MFGRINFFLFGLVIGGAVVYGGQRYHVVRTNDGLELVPKITSSFEDTYVDVRNFGVADWTNHKMLAAALATNNKTHVFSTDSAESVNQQFGKLIDGLRQ